MTDLETKRRRFLEGTYLTNSIRDSLTRGASLYKKHATELDRNRLRDSLKRQLCAIIEQYRAEVSDEQHISNIGALSDHLSSLFSEILETGRFPFGRAQKALNVYLKYRWCEDQTIRPPHCPFDEIVIGLLALPQATCRSWTKTDSDEDYRQWVASARALADAGNATLAEWELGAYEVALMKRVRTARAYEFERLSLEPKGDSHGWKFNREEIQRKL